jgi:hypothetical protein
MGHFPREDPVVHIEVGCTSVFDEMVSGEAEQVHKYTEVVVVVVGFVAAEDADSYLAPLLWLWDHGRIVLGHRQVQHKDYVVQEQIGVTLLKDAVVPRESFLGQFRVERMDSTEDGWVAVVTVAVAAKDQGVLLGRMNGLREDMTGAGEGPAGVEYMAIDVLPVVTTPTLEKHTDSILGSSLRLRVSKAAIVGEFGRFEWGQACLTSHCRRSAAALEEISNQTRTVPGPTSLRSMEGEDSKGRADLLQLRLPWCSQKTCRVARY